MELKRLRVLSDEIFKTLSNLNPDYIKDIFEPKENFSKNPDDITRQCFKTAKYGNKSIKFLRPKIWNHRPLNRKTDLEYLKGFAKIWLEFKTVLITLVQRPI